MNRHPSSLQPSALQRAGQTEIDQIYSFGEWIRERRVALDLTRAELAQRAGCSVSALRKIEGDERRPSKQLAALLAECLGIPREERAAFVKAARGELSSRRLGPSGPVPGSENIPPAALSNLPVPATPLIGRESELATLGQLLRDDQCRLLTIVGPGGIGKTRLALEGASAFRERLVYGAFFVPLAPLDAVEAIPLAVADAIGFTFVGTASPTDQLLNYLRDKAVLLLLDSAEHLVTGLASLLDLLLTAPGLKLLVTSRQRLGLQTEWTFAIEGLGVPPTGQYENLEDYSAVALFLQVAGRVQAGIALDEKEMPAIGRICQLLEGMPLGIELAAAWARVLSCSAIAQEIETSLDFVTATMRDVPERHRSLRAVFDRSWSLLSEDERAVLCRLSIFQGGFSRPAAEQVAGTSLPLLMALVDKSLLRRDQDGRYDLHDLVRQYARTKLEETASQFEATVDRHSAYYTSHMQQLEAWLRGERQLQALEEIGTEIDNIRAAWRHALARRNLAELTACVKAFWFFCEIRGWFREAEATFGQAAGELGRALDAYEKPDPAMQGLYAYLRANQGWFFLRLGRLEEAQRLLQSSLAELRACGKDRELVDALYYNGALAWITGDYASSRAHFLEELALATRMDDAWNVALAQGNLGLVTHAMGEYEESQRRWQTALDACRALGDGRMVGAALFFLGQLKHTLGAYDEAQVCLRESLALSRTVGDRWIHGLALGLLGQVAYALGDYAEAAPLLRDSLGLVRKIDEGWSTLRTLNGLGATALALGEYAEARSAYFEALQLGWEMQALPEVLSALTGMANWHLHQGALEAALLQIAHVLRHPATKEETKANAMQLCMDLESRLAPQQMAAVRTCAQEQSFEAFVEEVLARETH